MVKVILAGFWIFALGCVGGSIYGAVTGRWAYLALLFLIPIMGMVAGNELLERKKK